MNIGHHRLSCRGYDGKEDVWAEEDRAYIENGLDNPYAKYAHDPEFQRYMRSRYRKETLTGELVTNPKVVRDVVLVTDDKVKEVERLVVSNLPFHATHQVHYILVETISNLFMVLLQLEEQENESGSSQASTAKVPWDKPFIRGYNRAKDQSPLKRPHLGRITGGGLNRKHAKYGLAEPSTKESREAKKSQTGQEAEILKQKVANLEATMEQCIDERVNAKVAERMNALWLTMVDTVAGYLAGGRQGPIPTISLHASNSTNGAPQAEVVPPMEKPTPYGEVVPPMFVTPPASNAGGWDDSPAVAASTPPSMACLSPVVRRC